MARQDAPSPRSVHPAAGGTRLTGQQRHRAKHIVLPELRQRHLKTITLAEYAYAAATDDVQTAAFIALLEEQLFRLEIDRLGHTLTSRCQRSS